MKHYGGYIVAVNKKRMPKRADNFLSASQPHADHMRRHGSLEDASYRAPNYLPSSMIEAIDLIANGQHLNRAPVNQRAVWEAFISYDQVRWLKSI